MGIYTKEINLKLGNKLPRGSCQSTSVQVLLVGWLHCGCGPKNQCLMMSDEKQASHFLVMVGSVLYQDVAIYMYRRLD
jgi:hypothetical protein